MTTAAPPSAAALRLGWVLIDLEGDRAADYALALARRAVMEVRNGGREMADMLLEDATTIADLAYPEGTLDALGLEARIVEAATEYERRWPDQPGGPVINLDLISKIMSLGELGIMHKTSGDRGKAEAVFAEAREVARELGPLSIIGRDLTAILTALEGAETAP